MTLYAKLWCDIVGDQKLMRAARKGGKHLDKLPWLIAKAKERNDNGRLSPIRKISPMACRIARRR
jgi:hypothetical protein